MGAFFHGQNQIFSSEGLGYGYLYNWYAVSDANFAPTDWKVPINTEWGTLSTSVSNNGGELKETGLIHWNTPNTGANNLSGFTALGGGDRATDGNFYNIKNRGYFWCSNQVDASNGYYYLLYYNSTTISVLGTSKVIGMSVKLLYDGGGTPGATVTDYDGNVYDVVQIGTQYWTVQNFKCTTFNNGTAMTKVTDGTAWAALTTEGYCAYGNNENNV